MPRAGLGIRSFLESDLAHSRSFLVSDLSDLLTWLIKKEGMSELLVIKKKTKNVPKNMILVKCFRANRSFFVSERANERMPNPGRKTKKGK